MTKTAKNEILAAIRANKPGAVSHPLLRDFSHSGIEGDTLALFKKHLKEADGDFHRVHSARDIPALIAQLHPEAKIICSATPEVKGNRHIRKGDDPHSLADVEVGVFRAKFGIAENGAIYVTEEDLIITALAVLSQHLIVLLDPTQIVTNMHSAYTSINLHQNRYACFMMGPSATADIGAVHVNGAQGARSLNIVFLEKSQIA